MLQHIETWSSLARAQHSRTIRYLFIAILALSFGAPSFAALDGFGVNSSSFPNRYNGNEIWDGASFLNNWAQNGGATTASLSLNGSSLVIDNALSGAPASNNGWIDHDTGTTPWEVGSGSWTIEFTAKLNDTTAANDNFTLWTAIEGQRTNVTVTATGVSGGIDITNNLLAGVDNTAGLNTYRVAYDADTGNGWVWRDNVELTNSLGTVGDTNDRLIIGDCCTAPLGNPVDPFEIGYVRYDMSGAYSPIADQGTVSLNIDRATGGVAFVNTTSAALNILGYSILSDGGALDGSDWLSIGENYDAGNPGPNQVDANDNWTVLSTDSQNLDEAELAGGDGAIIAAGQTLNLGSAWIQQFNEDVTFEVLLRDGTISSFIVNYAGNGDEAFAFGDLSGTTGAPDGAVDVLDWNAFQAGYDTDLAGLSAAQGYLAADLDGDGAHTLNDFRQFETAFDAVNGAGAFAQIVVPEPTGLSLVACLGMGLSITCRRRIRSAHRFASPFVFAVAAIIGLGFSNDAQAVVTVLYDADPDGNAGTAAPDPTTVGWQLLNLDGEVTNAEFATAGLTSGGAGAWILNDAGDTGTAPNQSNSLIFDIDAATIEQMDTFGGTLTMEFEQLSTGGFFGIGYNAEAGDTDFGLSASTRSGQSPPMNLPTAVQTLTYAWDGTTFTFPSGSNPGGNNAEFWIGPNDGGVRVFFGDNTRNSAAFHVAITEVALDIAVVEPLTLTVNTATGQGTIANLGASSLDVDAYSITSESNALNSAGWAPLQGNASYSDGTPGNGVGFEIIGASSDQLAEANLTSFSTFSPNESVSLGNIFLPGGTQDLAFTMGLESGSTLAANVVYMGGGTLACDGDGDGDCVIDDINAMYSAFGSAGTFDFDGNGSVGPEDVAGWLASASTTQNSANPTGKTFVTGDLNLDGAVNSTDLGLLLNNFNASAGSPGAGVGWGGGDVSMDGAVNSTDLGRLLNNFNFASASAAAVPEPSAFLLVMFTMIGLMCRTRRSRFLTR